MNSEKCTGRTGVIMYIQNNTLKKLLKNIFQYVFAYIYIFY